MHKSQQQVREFHKAFDYPISPAEPLLRSADLRANLIVEETIETVIALVGAARTQTIVQGQLQRVLQKTTQNRKTESNIVDVIDGLCDLKYVIDGTFEDIGIDGEPFFEEVHRANMAKSGGGRDDNGKVKKPEGWSPPDIAGVLQRIVAARTVEVVLCACRPRPDGLAHERGVSGCMYMAGSEK
jgi:predicted HAD superfamily Cof-like phosphohydrolase